MKFVALEKLFKLTEGFKASYKVGANELILLRHNDKDIIIDARCPHAGASMVKGKLVEGRIRCPQHGLEFSIESGEVCNLQNGPCGRLQYIQPAYEGSYIGFYG